jgi:anti-anti-sigma regulatory factor
MSDQEERLREAVVRMEQALAAERRLRTGAEALLDAVRVIGAAASLAELDAELLPALRQAFDYEEAALLVMEEGGELAARTATAPALQGTRWRPGPLFARALAGHPSAVFDVRKVEEWAAQPESLLAGVRSAIHVPLSARGQAALLVGTHSQAAFFSPHHVDLARRFAQAAAPVLDSLAARDEQRQRELAEARAKLLEHANTALEVQLAMIVGQQAEIDRLSAPVLRVWRRVLVVPVVGGLDDQQTARVSERLLEAVVAQEARCAILDVTGLDRVDAVTIERLRRLARAVELLGARCHLTGVRPKVATAMAGMDLGGLRPFNTLADGLAAALRELGAAIGHEGR